MLFVRWGLLALFFTCVYLYVEYDANLWRQREARKQQTQQISDHLCD